MIDFYFYDDKAGTPGVSMSVPRFLGASGLSPLVPLSPQYSLSSAMARVLIPLDPVLSRSRKQATGACGPNGGSLWLVAVKDGSDKHANVPPPLPPPCVLAGL